MASHETSGESAVRDGSGARALPRIVSREEWQAARNELLAQEKELTRQLDRLAARRRRLPMVEIEKDYRFIGPAGEVGLGDLFEGRRQLILYNFMFAPEAAKGCSGCSMFVDNLGHPAHLNARDTTLVLVSRAPVEKLEEFRAGMGWEIPWYSSHGSEFNHDMGATTEWGETFRLNVFLREGERVFHTYATDGRGVEHLGSNWTLLDLTPLGRQESWEDSPPGWPQSPPYEWWRLHDEYGERGRARQSK